MVRFGGMRTLALLVLAASACTSSPTPPDKSFVAKMCGNPPDAPGLDFASETRADGSVVQCANNGELDADIKWRDNMLTWENCVLSLTAADVASGAI